MKERRERKKEKKKEREREREREIVCVCALRLEITPTSNVQKFPFRITLFSFSTSYHTGMNKLKAANIVFFALLLLQLLLQLANLRRYMELAQSRRKDRCMSLNVCVSKYVCIYVCDYIYVCIFMCLYL